MELRLFIFHHAGGSHLPYRGWPALLPPSWDVRLVDAPGRGLGADQAPIADADRLVDHFLECLGPELDGDYAFFGHSMGGLIAYELTRRILDAGRVPPRWLGLSARSAPRPEGEGTQRHLLSDGELRRELVAMGGTPGAVLENRDIWELFAPVIRNDLRLVETWRPRPESTPMPVPLSVFGGRDDAVAPPERLAGWADRADPFLGLRLFEGGHFYFQPDPTAVLRQLVEDVHRAMSWAEGPRRTAPVTG